MRPSYSASAEVGRQLVQSPSDGFPLALFRSTSVSCHSRRMHPTAHWCCSPHCRLHSPVQRKAWGGRADRNRGGREVIMVVVDSEGEFTPAQRNWLRCRLTARLVPRLTANDLIPNRVSGVDTAVASVHDDAISTQNKRRVSQGARPCACVGGSQLCAFGVKTEKSIIKPSENLFKITFLYSFKKSAELHNAVSVWWSLW